MHTAALKLDQQGDFSFATPPQPQLSTPQIRAGRYINSLRSSSDKGSTEMFLRLWSWEVNWPYSSTDLVPLSVNNLKLI